MERRKEADEGGKGGEERRKGEQERRGDRRGEHTLKMPR